MNAKRQAVLVLESNHSQPELRKYGVLYRELGAVSRPGRRVLAVLLLSWMKNSWLTFVSV